jgi:hypothetical protein
MDSLGVLFLVDGEFETVNEVVFYSFIEALVAPG